MIHGQNVKILSKEWIKSFDNVGGMDEVEQPTGLQKNQTVLDKPISGPGKRMGLVFRFIRHMKKP